jgi:chromosome segregation ATPase
MSFITRNILRWGIIGALAVGVSVVLFPDHVAVLRTKAEAAMNKVIDDPIALRRQLAQLAEEYPDRIAEVRGEIAEVDQQIKQFERDVDIASRVVAMATEDLQELKTLVARAESEAETTSRAVMIRHEGVRFDLDEAYAEGRRINSVRLSYEDRLAHDKFQLKFLAEQKGRLSEILEKLEDEYNTYQTQLWQLDRQIDAIERNERLIELTEEQQATLESYERLGKVQNLKQVEARLAELRAKQEAQLEHLQSRRINNDYEERAEYELDAGDVRNEDPFDDVDATETEEDAEEISDRSVAFRGPIVID